MEPKQGAGAHVTIFIAIYSGHPGNLMRNEQPATRFWEKPSHPMPQKAKKGGDAQYIFTYS